MSTQVLHTTLETLSFSMVEAARLAGINLHQLRWLLHSRVVLPVRRGSDGRGHGAIFNVRNVLALLLVVDARRNVGARGGILRRWYREYNAMSWAEVAVELCLDRGTNSWTEEVAAAEAADLQPQQLYEYMQRRERYLKTIIHFSRTVKQRLGLAAGADPAAGRMGPRRA
jgi:hypothetical protein